MDDLTAIAEAVAKGQCILFLGAGVHYTTSGDGTARAWPLQRIPGGNIFLPPLPQQQQMAK